MKLHLLTAFLGGTLAAGCAPTYSLTIHTNPQGALLVERGTGSQYLSPAVLTYELTEQHRKSDGCFHVQPVEARWASGAAAASSERIELCGNYASWTMTIERPTDAPGLEQDVAAAAVRERQLKLAQMDQEIRHLESQARMAAASEQGGYAIGCAIAGGCPTNRAGGLGTGWGAIARLH